MDAATALIVVDVQQAFDDAEYWGRRNNPECEANVARLIEAWRGPRVYVRHDSDEPDSPLRPDRPGNAFKPEVSGEPDLLVTKQVNSAFYGSPDLDAWLRERGISSFALCGITTNHCVETTARMGGNLGYDVLFVLDACAQYDREGPVGEVVTAEELTRATAASLHDEFATVVSTRDLVG
jgi:nicotinamidase-related amidase